MLFKTTDSPSTVSKFVRGWPSVGKAASRKLLDMRDEALKMLVVGDDVERKKLSVIAGLHADGVKCRLVERSAGSTRSPFLYRLQVEEVKEARA
jgi:hypothetical protein